MTTQREEEVLYNALFGTRVRFFIMIIVLLCLTSIWSNILTMNIAIICMAHPSENETDDRLDHYTFNQTDKTWMISIVAIAALIANFFVVIIINRIGIRTVFTALGILSAVSTTFIPFAIRQGFPYFLACRFLQGIAFSANFPIIGAFCAKWAYFKQVGVLVSLLVAYVQLSPAITMSVSGPMCSSLGWPSVFYAHGAATLFIFILYGFVYRNSPSKHPFVGTIEKGKIAVGKVTIDCNVYSLSKKSQRAIPYGAIFRTPAVWAVWTGAFANFAAVNLMLSFSPIYLSKALGFSVHKTGFSAAAPPLAQFLMKVATGAISDRIKFISETNKLRLFNSLAMVTSAISFLILAFLGNEHPITNLIALGAAAGSLGAATGGFFKAGPLISRQYSHFVTGIFSQLLTGTMLLIPLFVQILKGGAGEGDVDGWERVWIGIAIILFVCNAIFCIFVRGEPCEWTTEEWISRNSVRDLQGMDIKRMDKGEEKGEQTEKF